MLIAEHGKDDARVTEARQTLERELDATLTLRFQREDLRIKELQNRLRFLEQQIAQRKAQRSAIVERRADELIKGENLKWDVSGIGTGEANSNRAPSASSPVQQ